MGGRGVSSATLKDFLKQFGGAKFSKDSLGFANHETLKEAIGTRGAALAPDEAMKGANPHYSVNFAEYSENCQRAVVAYELRRRGYTVTAQPTYKGDTLGYSVPHVNKDGGRNGLWMGAFQGAKTQTIGASTRKKTIANIEAAMSGFGSGSRAIVRVQWSGNNGGHVFNAEREGSKTVYRDAQTGRKVNISHYMDMARPSKTQIVRTDNLRISERAKKSVTTRR